MATSKSYEDGDEAAEVVAGVRWCCGRLNIAINSLQLLLTGCMACINMP
jgi:hypothetical protein